MESFLFLALALAWLVGLPVLAARSTYRVTGWQLVGAFVLFWVITTLIGAVVYLAARAWYRGHRDTSPAVVEPIVWATPAGSANQAEAAAPTR